MWTERGTAFAGVRGVVFYLFRAVLFALEIPGIPGIIT